MCVWSSSHIITSSKVHLAMASRWLCYVYHACMQLKDVTTCYIPQECRTIFFQICQKSSWFWMDGEERKVLLRWYLLVVCSASSASCYPQPHTRTWLADNSGHETWKAQVPLDGRRGLIDWEWLLTLLSLYLIQEAVNMSSKRGRGGTTGAKFRMTLGLPVAAVINCAGK